MKFAVLAALVAATLAAPVLAADWVLVSTGVEGHKTFVDRQSIRTTPSGYKRAWTDRFYPEIDKFGDNRVTVYKEFDCIQNRNRNLNAIYYSGERVTTTDTTVSEWVYVAPETIGETLQKFVCRK
jgi:hypothetical protein